MWKFAFDGKHTFRNVLNKTITFKEWLIFRFIASSLKSQAWAQGIGRHDQNEINQFIVDDLKTLSAILGENKYILGDTPCEDDCAVFGSIAGLVFSDDFLKLSIDDGNSINLKSVIIYY